MIDEKNFDRTRQKLRIQPRPRIVKAQDEKYNRKLLEHGAFDILLDVEFGEIKLRQIESGLNTVLVRLAAKNNISFALDLGTLRSLKKKQKAIRLAQIKQNIKLCRKMNVDYKLHNIKNIQDAYAFMQSLGASTSQSKRAIKQ